MTLEYFSWSTLQLRELRKMAYDILKKEYETYDNQPEIGGDDADDRIATSIYRTNLHERVSAWRSHFSLERNAIHGYDQSKWVPAGVQSWLLKVDFNMIADQLIAGVSSGALGLDSIYRPKIFEMATKSVMEWLRSRPAYVDRVDPRSFEAIVAEVLQDKGWQVELTKQTRDGGYDILAIKLDIDGFLLKLLVECKLYDIRRAVGLPMIDRLMGVVSREEAASGLLVTNSRFTSTAWKAWEHRVNRDLKLVDRGELFEWLGEYQGRGK